MKLNLFCKFKSLKIWRQIYQPRQSYLPQSAARPQNTAKSDIISPSKGKK
jgi:hypothetical protein